MRRTNDEMEIIQGTTKYSNLDKNELIFVFSRQFSDDDEDDEYDHDPTSRVYHFQ